MTVSPESTRPVTRRSLRERGHAPARSASDPSVDSTDVSPAAPVLPADAKPVEQVGTTPAEPAEPADTKPVRTAIITATPFSRDTGAVDATDPTPTPEHDAPAREDVRALSDDPEQPTTGAPLVLSDIAAVGSEGGAADTSPVTAWADDRHPITALTWVDPQTVASPTATPEIAPPLFSGARLSPAWRRARVIIPVGIITALCATYVGGTLLAPLDNVAPAVTTEQVEIAAAPAATAAWPANGSAAVAVEGMAPIASTTERDQIASISKVASVMMVLDKLPLKVGEQGPSFSFTRADQREYLHYRRSNQSSLDVPVGGSLTEYQMLQGVLLGSANNYIDRLSDELWGSDRAFSDAASRWLHDNGIDGITLENPSGFTSANVASPEALLRLGELAMRNPVFAEIVGTRSAEIPGVGTVTNTNQMLDDPGVIGIKTGTYDHWNLLTAKEVKVDDTTVRLFTSVLGQDSSKERLAVTRALLAGVEKSLADQPVSVPKGTVVGRVTTEWGDKVDIVTDADTKVVLWNGATATATATLELGSKTTAGAKAGALSAKGPVNAAETTVSLAEEVTEPSAWWRLTHPLELFGVDKQ